MLCGSKSLYFWLNAGPVIATEIDYTSGSPIDRAFLSMLMIIGFFILYKRKIDWPQILKSNAWILILFLYMGLSILWSDFMVVSFKRWIKTIGNLIMVLLVLTEPDAVKAIKRIFTRCAYVLIPLSVLFIKYFRHIGVAYTRDGSVAMWVGVTTHKNALGQLSFICAFFLLWNILTVWRKKKVFIDMRVFIDSLVLLMALWLLNGSKTADSKTSIFVFVMGISIYIALGIMKRDVKHVGTYIFAMSFSFVLLQLAADVFLNDSLLEIVVSSSGRDMTFTGRTLLWKELIDIGSRHPILGAGYGSFWIGNLSHDLWDIFGWKPEQSHNGYIDVYVELGLVGLFLLIGVIFFAYTNMRRTLMVDFEYGRFRIALLVMILAYNITEGTFTKGTSLLWFLFILIAMDIPINSRYQLKAHRESSAR